MVFYSYSDMLNLPLWLIGIVIVWSLVWKGLALWKSARLNQPIWFVALLVINTLGILEILYVFLFSEIKLDKVDSQKGSKKTNIKNKLKKSSSKSRRKK